MHQEDERPMYNNDPISGNVENSAENNIGEIDPRLLEVLVCPLTRKALVYDRAAQELISPSLGLAFPIRSGVPIMLVEQARKFEPHR